MSLEWVLTGIFKVRIIHKLKLIDRLRVTCCMPLDYWQTDNSNGLVMVIRNYHWLNSASWVLISTCSAPLVQTVVQSRSILGLRQTDRHTHIHGHYQTYYRPCYMVDKNWTGVIQYLYVAESVPDPVVINGNEMCHVSSRAQDSAKKYRHTDRPRYLCICSISLRQ